MCADTIIAVVFAVPISISICITEYYVSSPYFDTRGYLLPRTYLFAVHISIPYISFVHVLLLLYLRRFPNLSCVQVLLLLYLPRLPKGLNLQSTFRFSWLPTSPNVFVCSPYQNIRGYIIAKLRVQLEFSLSKTTIRLSCGLSGLEGAGFVRAPPLYPCRNLARTLCVIFPTQVTQALTLPTTRSLCEARGTACYITTATDLYVGSKFPGQIKQVLRLILVI